MRLLPAVAVASALSNGALAQKMSERFAVSSTCDTRDMDQVLKDAINLADASIKALDPLVKGGWFNLRGVPKGVMTAATEVWGVEKPSAISSQLSQEDKDRLNAVQGNFQKVHDALAKGNGMGTEENTLHCNGDKLEFKKTISEVWEKTWSTRFPGRGKDDLIADEYPNEDPPITGWWKDPDHKTKDDDWNNILDEYSGEEMCGDHAAEGITYYQAPKNMFICPKMFDNYQKNLPSRDETGRLLWDDIKSVPGAFLHEMMHWLDSTNPHIIDEPVKVDGKTGKAYGLFRCWLLAGNAPNGESGAKDKLVSNADSYHVFATMVWASKADILPFELP